MHTPSMPAHPGSGTSERPVLTRQAVIETALRLIDERGLDRLSMRALGAELGVEAMSLYRHVPSKAALLDGVVALLLDELAAAVPGTGDWQEALAALATAHRAAERRHPGAYPLLARMPARAWATARGLVAGYVSVLTDAGFTEAEAARVLRLIARYVIGFSVTRPVAAAEPDPPAPGAAGVLLGQLADPGEEDRLFAMGLEALIAGLSPGVAAGRDRERGD